MSDDTSSRTSPPLLKVALVDVLDAFSSNEPVPGGGSAAALAGALGVSLLIMVAGLPRTRNGTPEETADLAAAAVRLRSLRNTLAELVDRDSDAYAEVLRAMRLPKTTEPEVQARRAAIEAATRAAVDVPMDTMRTCQQALRGAVVIATCGNANAATDTGTGVLMLLAGLRGAALNVTVNLTTVADTAWRERTSAERDQLASDAEADARRATDRLS